MADAEPPPLVYALDKASEMALDEPPPPPPDAIAFDDAWAFALEPAAGNIGNHLIMISPDATASDMDIAVASASAFTSAKVNTNSLITMRLDSVTTRATFEVPGGGGEGCRVDGPSELG